MKKEKELSVHIKKDFPVPVNELYKAWISPKGLKQWWSPMGKKLKDVKNELHEGGDIKYSFEDSEGPLLITGTYEKVNETKELVYTWDFNFAKEAFNDNLFRLTVKFSDKNGESQLEVLQENIEEEEAVVVHREGWERQLKNLYTYLASA